MKIETRETDFDSGVYDEVISRTTAQEKAEYFRSLFLVVAACLAISVEYFSSSSDFLALVGVIYFFLFPVVLFETINKFFKFKIPKIGKIFEWSLKWLFGTPVVFFIYFLRQYVSIESIYFIVLITFVVCVIQLTKFATKVETNLALLGGETKKKTFGIFLKSILPIVAFKNFFVKYIRDKNKRKSLLLDLIFLTLIFAYYQFFFSRWAPDYTQMTDLFNHNTVANKLNQGEFALFPDQLTQSIQLSSYLTTFHTLLASCTSFFTTDALFNFQVYSQIFLIPFFYFLFKDFIKKLTNTSNILAGLASLIIMIPNSPNLSFNKFAVAPNQVIFALLPAIIILTKDKKYRLLVFSIILLSTFHFFSTALLLLPVFLILFFDSEKGKRILKEKKLWILNLIVFTSSLLLILNAFFFKIEITELISPLATKVGFNIESLAVSTKRDLWSSVFYISPPIFAFLILSSTFFIFCFDRKWLWASLSSALFFCLYVSPIPFGHRFSSILLIFVPLLLIVVLNKTCKSESTKILITFLLVYFSSFSFLLGAKNYTYEYYNYPFWSKKDENFLIQKIKKDLDYNKIEGKDVYVLTEPMVKMLAQSVFESEGAGTYMYPEERERVHNFIVNKQFYCGDSDYKYMVFIYTPRVYQWDSNPKYRTSGISNVWFYTGQDLNSIAAINSFDSSFFEDKIINKTYENNLLYILAKC